MKWLRYGLIVVFLGMLAGPAFAREFDVCINPAADFRLDDADGSGDLSAGDGFVALGIIVPGGTIPQGGVAADCTTIADLRIGTFFARGRIVLGLPAAAPDDLAYVDWQFRIEQGHVTGAIDTTGPVKIAPQYPQTITGATGGLGPAKGAALTKTLDADGFQIRLIVPGNKGKED